MPGTSGLLCPTIETDGLYLSDNLDPEDFAYEFSKDKDDYLEAHGYEVIRTYTSKDDYYDNRNEYREVLQGLVINSSKVDIGQATWDDDFI